MYRERKKGIFSKYDVTPVVWFQKLDSFFVSFIHLLSCFMLHCVVLWVVLCEATDKDQGDKEAKERAISYWSVVRYLYGNARWCEVRQGKER